MAKLKEPLKFLQEISEVLFVVISAMMTCPSCALYEFDCTTSAGRFFPRAPLACGNRVITTSPRLSFMCPFRSGRASLPIPPAADRFRQPSRGYHHTRLQKGVYTRPGAAVHILARYRERVPGGPPGAICAALV